MTSEAIIEALALPPDARLSRRVPKKLLVDNGAPTQQDKRILLDGIAELTWLASLRPSSIGVPAFRDPVREYVEIVVLSATLRPDAKGSRILVLIHRALPYPVLLVTANGGSTTLSLANKRWSQGEMDTVVLDGELATTDLTDSGTLETAFTASLAVTAQPRSHLYALYQGWLDRMTALAAARLTGTFALPDTQTTSAVRRAALAEHAQVQREITALRAQAAKEKQISHRVEINLAIQRREERLRKLTAQL